MRTSKIYIPEEKYYFTIYVFQSYHDLNKYFFKKYKAEIKCKTACVITERPNPNIWKIGELWLVADDIDTETIFHESGHMTFKYFYHKKEKIDIYSEEEFCKISGLLASRISKRFAHN